jgi:hypothetical protein
MSATHALYCSDQRSAAEERRQERRMDGAKGDGKRGKERYEKWGEEGQTHRFVAVDRVEEGGRVLPPRYFQVLARLRS